MVALELHGTCCQDKHVREELGGNGGDGSGKELGGDGENLMAGIGRATMNNVDVVTTVFSQIRLHRLKRVKRNSCASKGIKSFETLKLS